MKQKLHQYTTALETLQQITETYQEIASVRMRKAKDAVLQNRDFYNPLLEIYQNVSNIYFQLNHKTFRQETNGRSLALLFTSNTGLYGSINRGVFDLFMKTQADSQSDLAVAGRLGKIWLEKAGFQKQYTYFDIEDNLNSEEAYINRLFTHIVKYAEVRIYHGLFNTIVSQTPQLTELTKKFTAVVSDRPTLSFIFEPSIDKVLAIFEQQLLSSFFTQTIMESNLAKNSSRMMSLDIASQNIKMSLHKSKLQKLLIKHRLQNKKQQEQAMAFFSRRTA